MFIYDKLIGDLPDNFYEFKEKIHQCFPIIYDTKAIASHKFEMDKTKLEDLHKNLVKKGL